LSPLDAPQHDATGAHESSLGQEVDPFRWTQKTWATAAVMKVSLKWSYLLKVERVGERAVNMCARA